MAPLNSDTQALTPPNGDIAETRKRFWALTFGSIGVVYGDIGTSPLYAMREAILAASGEGMVTPEAVYGVLSLIFWSLIVVVTLKYVLILLRADNHGEGGTLALTALAFRALGRRTPLVLALGIVGASMFYGSTLITPALSVLSAVEGLNVATAAFGPYVLPLTVVILFLLFSVQSHGTARVSALFAPVTMVWFLVIAIAGAVEIAANPDVLAALNPILRHRFPSHPWRHRAGHAGRRVPRRHRLGSPLQRSRPFRTEANSDGVARFRAAGAAAQLFRPRRLGA